MQKFHPFCRPNFSVGANLVCTEIFTRRPVLTRQHRDFHRETGFNPGGAGLHTGWPGAVPGVHWFLTGIHIWEVFRRRTGAHQGRH
jgi:hypothetical protein